MNEKINMPAYVQDNSQLVHSKNFPVLQICMKMKTNTYSLSQILYYHRYFCLKQLNDVCSADCLKKMIVRCNDSSYDACAGLTLNLDVYAF